MQSKDEQLVSVANGWLIVFLLVVLFFLFLYFIHLNSVSSH